MTDKEKLEKIKKIIDNDNKGWWDDTKIMCDKISDIIYGEEVNNDGRWNKKSSWV